MELFSFLSDLWYKKNSKGKWHTKDGDSIYIEQLTNEHLMRIPHFIFKRYGTVKYILPEAIIEEIKYRNMIILKDQKYKVLLKKQKCIKLNKKKHINYDITQKKKKKNTFNKIFFR